MILLWETKVGESMAERFLLVILLMAPSMVHTPDPKHSKIYREEEARHDNDRCSNFELNQ
jgi:hypothetical protein